MLSITDFDDLFKSYLKDFLTEYITLFYPHLLPFLDLVLANISWVDGESIFQKFTGLKPRRFSDRIANIPLSPAGRLEFPKANHFLFATETEKGKSVSDFRPRMEPYHTGLKERFPNARVFLNGLYIDVALNGLGNDSYICGDRQILSNCLDRSQPLSRKRRPSTENPSQFSWEYVGLRGLVARDYLQLGETNRLVPGLIGFMKIKPEERQEIFVTSILQINSYEIDMSQKNLLARGLYAGMKLSDEEEEQFKKALQAFPEFQRTENVILTWYDKGEANGIQKIVFGQLTHKFGSLPEAVLNRVHKMQPDQLQKLSIELLDPSKKLVDLGLAGRVKAK